MRKKTKHIDLLLLTSDDKNHYVWIKNMSALICHRSKGKHAVFVCPHCIHPFKSKKAFDNHFDDCAKHKYQAVRYPKEYTQESILMWRSREKNRTITVCYLRGFQIVFSPRAGSIECCRRTRPIWVLCLYSLHRLRI
jgi:hypothetical protein